MGAQRNPTEAKMKTKQQKIDTATQLSEKISKAKSVVLADYKGLTMKQLSDLRSKLSSVNSEFTITKNTSLQHAFPTSDIRYPISDLIGPTATLLAYGDEISPIKMLVKAIKDAGIGSVKLGFLGKDAMDSATILKLASLPSKDELRAKTVGILAAPLRGMVGVLQGNLRNLVYALNQMRIQKGGE